MRIVHAKVFIGKKFQEGGIEFDEKIMDVFSGERCGKLTSEDIDAEGMYLIPGLIDIHTHGAVGIDVCEAENEELRKLSEYYAWDGVTSWCPTTATVTEKVLVNAMHRFRDFVRPENGAKIAAVNMEGPFLSRSRAGAMNLSALRVPNKEMFFRLQKESGGIVKIVSVAPELDGASDFIREVSGSAAVALGHTDADYETAKRAFCDGASHITHLFNCIPGIAHRNPGPIPAAIEEGATVELITDGYHVHPSVIRLAFRLFGDRVVLISDSLTCAGFEDGEYFMSGNEITVLNGKATLKGRETLAGSSIHLMEGLRRSVRFGIPLEEAVYAATRAPSVVIGCDDRIGSISPGKEADLVLLDSELRVKEVFICGKQIR